MERDKAASNKDFFLLFSSNEQPNVMLPQLSGIVDKSNWTHYFGPFAGRAFVFARTGALDINLASRRELQQVSGIGINKADLIIRERGRKRFDSLDDASARLHGMGKDVLRGFKFLPAA
jgi:DNA uptake protein ComE-like DNA-binding protein